MANHYKVKCGSVSIAMAHIKPHPQYDGQMMISVIPILKKDGREDSDGTFKLERALYGAFPDTTPATEALMELLIAAGIEPEKTAIKPVIR